jgi:hypothetical protein
MEPEERFERIEATLALSAEDHRRAMATLDKRHQLAMEEIDKRHEAAMKRMDRLEAREREDHRRIMEKHAAAMERLDRLDKNLRGTQKLVEVGWRAIRSLAVEDRRARADTAALRVEMRAFFKAWGNGRAGSNGKGRH